jgi:hypothetical protein
MRVLLAGLFIVFGTGAVVSALATTPEEEPPVWVLSAVAVFTFVALLLLAFAIFNRPGLPRRSGTAEDFTRKLEEEGLLTSQEDFEARRAFEIREFEDEGAHYMVELRDGSVLYLNGQYLYEYEPIDDDPEFDQPRRFPCTAFTVRRHLEEEYVIDITCRGEVFEPECTAPCFDPEDFREGRIPHDGQLITDRSYDEIKSERMKA